MTDAEILALRLSIARRFGARFVWGRSDCVLAASAVLADMGRPVASPCAWASEAEALAELRARGGLEAALDKELTASGWSRFAGEPQAGDVGIVERHRAQSCAIHDGDRWSAKTPRGLLRAQDALAMWRRF